MAPRNNDNIPALTPYNPLDKRHLGEQVAEALLEQDVQPLPPSRFIGAGVYALYYIGDFPAYSALTEVTRMTSISARSMLARLCRREPEKAVRERMLSPVLRCISDSMIMPNPSKQRPILISLISVVASSQSMASGFHLRNRW